MGRASRDPSSPRFPLFVQHTVMVGLVPAMTFLSHRSPAAAAANSGSSFRDQVLCSGWCSVGNAGVDVPAHMVAVGAAGRPAVVRHANPGEVAVGSVTAIIPRQSVGGV